MGERAAARRAQQLVEELDPGCLAMCGICAGDRKKVALGDVIVAELLYQFAGVLEAPVLRNGALVELRILAAVDQAITVQLVDHYQADVELRFRQQDPLLRSTLVHSGAPAPVDLAQAAWKRGVVLTSFGEYQRLCDFGPYLAKQTSRLDSDLVYPRRFMSISRCASGTSRPPPSYARSPDIRRRSPP